MINGKTYPVKATSGNSGQGDTVLSPFLSTPSWRKTQLPFHHHLDIPLYKNNPLSPGECSLKRNRKLGKACEHGNDMSRIRSQRL